MAHLKLQGLELDGQLHPRMRLQKEGGVDSAQEVGWTLQVIRDAIVVGVFSASRRRTTCMLREARFIGAEVHVVGDGIPVPISSPGVRTAVFLRQPGLVGAEVIGVSDAISVPVRTTSEFGQPRLIWADVIYADNPVAVIVRTARVLR